MEKNIFKIEDEKLEGVSGGLEEDDASEYYYIDVDMCVSCGLCGASCSEGAIDIDERGNYYINGKCVGCGFCEGCCPLRAIRVR